jgi:hypothetical protein
MENAREVFRALRDAQTRYTYFLLAAAGAAIALAVNKTDGVAVAWSQLPLALAVANWGASFFFGCRHLHYVASNLYANGEMLRVQAGTHPMVGAHAEMMAAASEGIRSAMASNDERSTRFAKLQFALLVLGAILFLVWHVFEMHQRRVAIPVLV